MSHKENKKLRRNARRIKHNIENSAIEQLFTQIRNEPIYKRVLIGWRLVDQSPRIQLQGRPVGISMSTHTWATAMLWHPSWWDRRVHATGWVVTLCGVRVGWRRV